MIVHILPPSATFKAVRYNTNKVDRNKGELMKVAGFGVLGAMENVRPDDYKNFLQAQSALNKRVRFPQLHAVISAKGKTHNKEQLTEIATQWLAAMGYGKQPYLIIYHKDTANSHVHIVTTRIDEKGKKISSGFEHIRAVNSLNGIMGLDEKHSAAHDMAEALKYSCTTKAQLLTVLDSKGYTLKEDGTVYEVIKFGVLQGKLELADIDKVLAAKRDDEQRRKQLKAIFYKYAASPDYLKTKFGIELIFHASPGKPPYGYTVIDHAQKFVFKGGEIMPLKKLLNKEAQPEPKVKSSKSKISKPTTAQRAYYYTLLRAAMFNYPDLRQGLAALSLRLVKNDNGFFLNDLGTKSYWNVADILSQEDYGKLSKTFDEEVNKTEKPQDHIPDIFIASDIDDEAIHGRNRKRKKKARTNSR